MKNLYLVACLLTLFLFSCKKEEIQNPPTPNPSISNSIEEPFVEYVERFLAEGEKRGYSFSDNKLTVKYAVLRNFCGVGYSNYQNTNQQLVEINSSGNCWEDRTDLEKENLMFHELGHALLNRPHISTFLPNGSNKSIMCSSEICNGWNNYGPYTLATKEYYLDELFDSNTPVPEWGKTKTEETVVFEDNFVEVDTNWKFFIAGDVPDSNFVREINATGEETLSYINIESKAEQANNVFSAWRYTIPNPNLPEGGTLQLKVNVSVKNVTGGGGSVVLRTDSGSDLSPTELSGFATTQGNSLIGGVFENRDFTVNIGYYPSDVKNILIFLLMQGDTKGEIQFNEVELTYLE